jgi:hypothetical protein
MNRFARNGSFRKEIKTFSWGCKFMDKGDMKSMNVSPK